MQHHFSFGAEPQCIGFHKPISDHSSGDVLERAELLNWTEDIIIKLRPRCVGLTFAKQWFFNARIRRGASMNCTTAANQESLNVYVPRVIQLGTQWADAGSDVRRG